MAPIAKQPFYTGGIGEGRNSLRRLGRQPGVGIPAPESGYVDSLGNGGVPQIQFGTIPRTVIQAGRQAQPPMDGPIMGPNSTWDMGDLNVAEPAVVMSIAQFFTAYDQTNPGTGWQRYVMSANGGTPYGNPLTLLDDPNTGLRARFHDLLIAGIDLSLAPNQGAKLSLPIVTGAIDFHAPGVQTTGSGSTVPLLRHTTLCNPAAPDGADFDIEMKVVSTTSSAWTVLVKPTHGGTFGTNQTVIPISTAADPIWQEAIDSTTTGPIGQFVEAAEFYLPPGATASANDVFRYGNRRQAWSPSYAVARPISAIGSRIWFGERRLPVDNSLAIKFAAGKAERRAGMERQPIGTQIYGADKSTITLVRQITDMTLQSHLIVGDVIPFTVQFRSNKAIGANPAPYQLALAYPECRVTGVMWGTTPGGENKTETVTLEPGVPAGGAYTVPGLGVSVGTYAAAIIDTDITALP